ncbi:MAG: hypothetical protein ACKO96_41925, partial [Flammeovirgaceae bacterium]
MQALQLLSEALRDSTTGKDAKYWVTTRQIRDLVNNKEAFKIFLGLVQIKAEQNYGNVEFQNTNLVVALTRLSINYDTNYSDYLDYKAFVLGFSAKAEVLSKLIQANENPTTDSLRFELYTKYFRNSVDFIEYSTKVVELPYIKE